MDQNDHIQITIWDTKAGTVTYTVSIDRENNQAQLVYTGGKINPSYGFVQMDAKDKLRKIAESLMNSRVDTIEQVDEIAMQFPEQDRARVILIKNDYLNHLTYSDIAWKYGVSKRYISRIAKAYGLKRRGTRGN